MRLPTDRAFLIRLSSDAEPSPNHLCGRIEHVQTGRRARFDTPEELQAFVILVLSEQDANPGALLEDDQSGQKDH